MLGAAKKAVAPTAAKPKRNNHLPCFSTKSFTVARSPKTNTTQPVNGYATHGNKGKYDQA